MESRSLYIRVGALIVLGLGMLVTGILMLAGNSLFNSKTTRIMETYFSESVQGLDVGAPVKFRGVTIGRVSQIGLVNSEYRQPGMDLDDTSWRLVYVRMEITADLAPAATPGQLVVDGLRVQMASQGITGVSYIEANFVQPDRHPVSPLPWVPHHEYVPSIPSTITQVQSAAEKFLERLDTVDFVGLIGNVSGLVGDLRGQLRNGEASVALSEASGLLRLLRGTAERADLPGAMQDLRAATASLRAVLDGPELRDVMRSTSAAADKLPALIASLEVLTRRADSRVADVGRDLEPILRDARATLANLRATSELLRQYPAQVLFGGTPPREPARATESRP